MYALALARLRFIDYFRVFDAAQLTRRPWTSISFFFFSNNANLHLNSREDVSDVCLHANELIEKRFRERSWGVTNGTLTDQKVEPIGNHGERETCRMSSEIRADLKVCFHCYSESCGLPHGFRAASAVLYGGIGLIGKSTAAQWCVYLSEN